MTGEPVTVGEVPTDEVPVTPVVRRRSRESGRHGTPTGTRDEMPDSWSPWVMCVAYAVALVPVLAATLSVIGADWAPMMDYPIELMRTADVGGAHTPIVGAWSRWGWSHPGPALFWYSAPWYRALGNDGVLVGMGVLSAAAIAGSIWIARRVSGTVFACLVALVITVVNLSRGVEISLDPWNPYTGFWPFMLFALASWACVCGHRWMLPVAVVGGTWCVQAHLGYGSFVAVFGLAAVAGVLTAALRERRDRDALRRNLVVAVLSVGIAVLMWAPPLIEQFGGAGNLSAVFDYLGHQEETHGWGIAWGIANVQFDVPAAWMGGVNAFDDGIAAHRRGAESLAAILVVAAAAAAAAIGRRWNAAALCAFGLVGTALAVWSTARLSGILVPYLMEWWWVVAALCTLGLVLVVLELAGLQRSRWVAVAVLVLASLAAGTSMVRGLPAEVPFEEPGVALRGVADSAIRGLDRDRSYVVVGVDRPQLNGSAQGLQLLLEQAGFDVFAERSPLTELQMGEHRVRDFAEVDAVITIVNLDQVDDPLAVPSGASEIARYDGRSEGGGTGYAVFVSPATSDPG